MNARNGLAIETLSARPLILVGLNFTGPIREPVQ